MARQPQIRPEGIKKPVPPSAPPSKVKEELRCDELGKKIKELVKKNKALEESMNELLELLKSFGSWSEAYTEIQAAIQKAESLQKKEK